MPLFAVSLLFSLEVHASDVPEPLREITLHVLFAADENEARVRGAAIGRAQEIRYTNQDGEEVRNIFNRVIEVQSLIGDSLVDGLEVASWMFRRGEHLVIDEKGVSVERG